jgi:hypothetical protein
MSTGKLEVREAVVGPALRKGEGAKILRDFLDVVDVVYAGDPAYVRPLDFDLADRLSKKNPFFDHAEGSIFVAYRDGRPVGRCTAQVDAEHLARYKDDVGFFGFLDTIDDQDVTSALIQKASAYLAGKGMRAIRGPVSLSINEELGCLVEGFDTPPMIMMPHHRPFQGGLLEGTGLAKIKDVYAWQYKTGAVPPRAKKAADDIEAMPEITSRLLDPSELERDVRIVMDIFNDAWSDNWGSVPLTEAELKKTASDMKLLLIPELTLLVYVDGEPAGFSIVLPNINEMIGDLHGKIFPLGFAKLLYRLKVKGARSARLALLGIRKKHRHVRKLAGLSTYMYVKMNDASAAYGIRTGELSWTLEDNGPVNVAIRLMGGKIYKRYRVYEKAL